MGGEETLQEVTYSHQACIYLIKSNFNILLIYLIYFAFYDCYILTCPNEPHQEGIRTLVQFNRTK